eukprot:c19808_g1_i1.p1 GENE.c19808_g1_i1~~c19808_g1_i1.p1  ORF type:complete len:401 (-),score=165.58 c19808_g1_i1:47-1249(-)
MPPKKAVKRKAEDEVAPVRKTNPAQGRLTWKMVGTLLIALPAGNLSPSSKLASFDLDGTLTDTASGRVFAKDKHDWRLYDSCVPGKLLQLQKDGYKVVIFSNQNGLAKGKQKTSKEDVQHKVHLLLDECPGLMIQVVMATEEDECRKPGIGMWKYYTQHLNGGTEVNLSESFYCGDAAGREEGSKSGKSDFSCSDRKFAHNVGLPFHTPEEFFLGEPKKKFSFGVDPREVVAQATPTTPFVPSTEPELVIMVGRPASGKSSYTKRFILPQGYVHVNQDTLKTEAACKKAIREAMEAKKHVVLDNTNPSKAKRSIFISIAEDYKYTVRCLVMQTPKELCEHNNMFRERVHHVDHVPRIAYVMFEKNFQQPSKSEGISEIIPIQFSPQFDSEEEKSEYLQFT